MSAYGPALFVKRQDKAPISATEQRSILRLVVASAKTLKSKNIEGKPAKPRHYDYGGYEPNSVGVLLFSWYGYDAMPEDAQRDEDDRWVDLGRKLGEEIHKTHPGYTFKCYYVED